MIRRSNGVFANARRSIVIVGSLPISPNLARSIARPPAWPKSSSSPPWRSWNIRWREVDGTCSPATYVVDHLEGLVSNRARTLLQIDRNDLRVLTQGSDQPLVV